MLSNRLILRNIHFENGGVEEQAVVVVARDVAMVETGSLQFEDLARIGQALLQRRLTALEVRDPGQRNAGLSDEVAKGIAEGLAARVQA